MELHWLRLLRSTVLELRPLKDYAGQDLIFNPGPYRRRCVTAEVLNSELVQRYLSMCMIEAESTVQAPQAAPSMAVKTPAAPIAPPEPVAPPAADPEPVLEPVVVADEVVAPAEVEPVAPVEVETEAPALDSEASVSESSPELSSSEDEQAKPSVESYKKKRR